MFFYFINKCFISLLNSGQISFQIYFLEIIIKLKNNKLMKKNSSQLQLENQQKNKKKMFIKIKQKLFHGVLSNFKD